jgi:phosphoribosylformimino-5-aminoimidazole carboxamide ribotide isomerase
MIQLIPAIDIIDGKCVRLTQGDYKTKKVYGNNPDEIAKTYEGLGAKRLHVVDLDGAKASEPKNLKALEKIAKATSLDIEWGGGVKTEEAVLDVIRAGASKVVCGSICIKEPDTFALWLKRYGGIRMILGADARNGMVAINGWEQDSTVSVSDLINQFIDKDLRRVICTDISKDGMLKGPTFELYTKLQRDFPALEITVSGGISSMDDIKQLDSKGLKSVIVGKAIYENIITLKDLEQWYRNE